MEVWGPQIGEVTCGGSLLLSCKRDQIKMRDYEDRRVTHQSGLPHLPGVPHLHVNRPQRRLESNRAIMNWYFLELTEEVGVRKV